MYFSLWVAIKKVWNPLVQISVLQNFGWEHLPVKKPPKLNMNLNIDLLQILLLLYAHLNTRKLKDDIENK